MNLREKYSFHTLFDKSVFQLIKNVVFISHFLYVFNAFFFHFFFKDIFSGYLGHRRPGRT